MITRAECIDILSSHADELRSRYGISSMRLFGSVARNSHKEGSDVDLIANHRHIRPFFKKQIEQDGIDIYTSANGR
ncbi:MAG: nucleotidyltransferase domain-containing protein [Prevotella sp.]|nr:nucleotidyltransferase domain-containing protein [Prevotella sp.]